MALLQIAEPGRAAAPHQHRLAVGIDLGTTNSLVATVRSAVPTVLADGHGRTLLPSVVHYGEEEVVRVGHEACERAAEDPANTIGSAKRLIGPSLAAVHADGFLGFVQGTGKQPSEGQPVTYDHRPDFDDYGLGCLLLAGSEVYRLGTK